ncbi:hypothetical protein [Ilyobacter polytropus]|uniref:Uncharacterized protein n=1 Tax=Ilyobacter polytropus (strain ATCC 51220 / DSM 2926 / LMG 16218 / CuHBu1) TaxID=572544 RepID=E3H886_ILYPC|nr:hypothetical protein [Ilyobacter polytropus]ADO81982.1 conserved hypothetical protein [Ilyobacter polytropus DSM 2926]
MEKIKCPHCGNLSGEVDYERVTKHFVCNECSSMFHTIQENGKIKVELEV